MPPAHLRGDRSPTLYGRRAETPTGRRWPWPTRPPCHHWHGGSPVAEQRSRPPRRLVVREALRRCRPGRLPAGCQIAVHLSRPSFRGAIRRPIAEATRALDTMTERVSCTADGRLGTGSGTRDARACDAIPSPIRRRDRGSGPHRCAAVFPPPRAERPELVNRVPGRAGQRAARKVDMAASDALYAEVLAGCRQVGDSYCVAGPAGDTTHIHSTGRAGLALKTIDRSARSVPDRRARRTISNADRPYGAECSDPRGSTRPAS